MASVPESGSYPGIGNDNPQTTVLAWKIPGTEEPDGLHSPWGCKELDKTQHTCICARARACTHTHTHTHTHISSTKSLYTTYTLGRHKVSVSI